MSSTPELIPENQKMNFSVKQSSYAVLLVIGIFALIYLGKTIFVPIAFALITSFILYPICCFLERKGVGRMWAIIWIMIVLAVVLSGVIFLFSAQIISITTRFHGFSDKLVGLFATVTNFINENIGIVPNIGKDELMDMSKEWSNNQSDEALKTTVVNTTAILANFVLWAIYTFLILLYRKGLKEGFVQFAAVQKRPVYSRMINEIQKVGQKYLSGMFLLMIILGLLNSLGLLLLGIDYPFFFGFFASLLAIIPYVGSIMGGAIPTFYAFMTYDSYWPAVGVFFVFWFIQIIEGNILSPKIVGGNLNLNAFVAIFVLVLGGFLWGIPGMILSLPFAAIFCVVCRYYVQLEPIASLLKLDLYNPKKRISFPIPKKILGTFRK